MSLNTDEDPTLHNQEHNKHALIDCVAMQINTVNDFGSDFSTIGGVYFITFICGGKNDESSHCSDITRL